MCLAVNNAVVVFSVDLHPCVVGFCSNDVLWGRSAGCGFSQQTASFEAFGHNVLSFPGTVNVEIFKFLLIYSGCKWFALISPAL